MSTDLPDSVEAYDKGWRRTHQEYKDARDLARLITLPTSGAFLFMEGNQLEGSNRPGFLSGVYLYMSQNKFGLAINQAAAARMKYEASESQWENQAGVMEDLADRQPPPQ